MLALARRFGTVLLNGSGFDGPPWSVRVSLANLDADDYLEIGQHLRELVERAVDQWKQLGDGDRRQSAQQHERRSDRP